MKRQSFIVALVFAGALLLVGLVYMILGLRHDFETRICHASQHDRAPLLKYIGTTVAEERLIRKYGLAPPAGNKQLARIQEENFHALVELYQAEKQPFSPCRE